MLYANIYSRLDKLRCICGNRCSFTGNNRDGNVAFVIHEEDWWLKIPRKCGGEQASELESGGDSGSILENKTKTT